MHAQSVLYQPLNNETDKYSTQELVPPPYEGEFQNECLPLYTDTVKGVCDERSQHGCYSEKQLAKKSTFEKASHLLDRMEDYRHVDQEWTSQCDMKRMKMINNMYHIHHKPSSNGTTRNMPSLSTAKSKYYKIALSIAKEREHIVHKMKKMRPSPSKSKSAASCKNEFDQFLNSIHHTSSQFEMANQRATLVIPIV